MGIFNVNVNVTEPETAVLHLNVNPESVLLDGKAGSQIIWTMVTGSLATFPSDGVLFTTPSGVSRFTVTANSPTQITATVNGEEDNETIYTYFLTVRMAAGVTIRIDPEVDNPPPPPGP